MTAIIQIVTRLFHPITLTVFLVGVAGFLFGLIIAVERQDATVAMQIGATATNVEAAIGTGAGDGGAQLEAALAERDAELADRQTELTELRAELTALQAGTSSQAALEDANSRIASLQAALNDSSAELKALQEELVGLSGQLAEAIQTRDEFRAETERVRVEGANQRANLERTVADLRRELETLQARAETLAGAPEVSEPEPATDTPPAPAQSAETADSVKPDPETASAEPAPTDAGSNVAAAEPAPEDSDEANRTEPQSTPVARPTGGPVSQGIAAYQAADYRRAYELWLPAALAGSSRAQFYVGALYYEGRGVETDRVTSYMWLRAATRADDPGAIRLLDQVREAMTGPELAEAETRIANGETLPEQ